MANKEDSIFPEDDPFNQFEEKIEAIKKSITGGHVVNTEDSSGEVEQSIHSISTSLVAIQEIQAELAKDVIEIKASDVIRGTSDVREALGRMEVVNPSSSGIEPHAFSGDIHDFATRDNDSFVYGVDETDKKMLENSDEMVDLLQEQVELSKQQLNELIEIKSQLADDTIAPLERDALKPVDITELFDDEKDSGGGGSSLAEQLLAAKGAHSIVTDGKKDKKDKKDKEKGKSKAKAPTVQKAGVSLSGMGKGAGLLGIAAGGYSIYQGMVNAEEHREDRIQEINDAVRVGEKTPEEAIEELKELGQEIQEEKVNLVSTTGGAVAGGLGGMKVGAMVGSVLGSAGAAVGAVAGGIYGSILGSGLGKDVGDIVNNSETLSSTVSEYSEKISESLSDAKEFIKTDIIEAGSSKISELFDSTKEFFNFGSKSSEKVQEINNLSDIQPDKTVEQINGMSKPSLIRQMETDLLEGGIEPGTNTIVPIVNNNVSTNTVYDTPKASPRNNSIGSALERYINKISSF